MFFVDLMNSNLLAARHDNTREGRSPFICMVPQSIIIRYRHQKPHSHCIVYQPIPEGSVSAKSSDCDEGRWKEMSTDEP